jgi:hypothetical protein
MQEEFNINSVVPLMLSVTDIQPYDSNNIIYPYDVRVVNEMGTITQCVSNVTWNIDLEVLLGNLYYQYEYFNLELIQFMTIPLTGGNYPTYKPMDNGVNIGYQNLNVFISGLKFVRSTYNQKIGTDTTYAHLCNISNQYNSTTNDPGINLWRGDEYLYYSQKGYANYNLCFKKEKHVKINIRFGAIDSGLDYCPESVFPTVFNTMHHFIAKFNIVPFK